MAQRTPRYIPIALGAFMLLLGVIAAPMMASAATGAVTLKIGADGTPSFDADDTPGHDSSPNNGRVRTQDSVALRMEWSINDADDTDVRAISVLPANEGLAWDRRLPNVCADTSTVSDDGLTLTCHLGDRHEGEAGTILTTVRVGSGLLDGDTFAVDFSLQADGTSPVVSNPVAVKVTSAPNIDFAKNTTEAFPVQYTTKPGTNEPGIVMNWPITAQVGGTGRGAENITGTVTLDDDLTGVSANAEIVTWDVPIAADMSVEPCGPNDYNADVLPFGRIGIAATATETNSVSDSGTWTCNQPDGPGAPISMTIAGADWSGATTPTALGTVPVLQPIPADQKFLVSGWVATFIPFSDLIDSGDVQECFEVPGRYYGNVQFTNKLTNIEAVGVSGGPNNGENPDNNSQTRNIFLTCPGNYSGHYQSEFNEFKIDGAIRNYKPGEIHRFRDPRPAILGGQNSVYPRTQTDTFYAGDGSAYPGQRFSYYMTMGGSEGWGEASSCVKFDPESIRVIDQPGYERRSIDLTTGLNSSVENVPGTPGKATVVHTYNDADESGNPAFPTYDFDSPEATAIVEGDDFVVEYGNGGYTSIYNRSVDVQCDDDDSPGGWHTNTADVPGGTDAITKVRVRFLRPLAPRELFYAWVSYEIREDAPVGSWADASASFKTDISDGNGWDYGAEPGYDPDVHAWNTVHRGDRLKVTESTISVVKTNSPELNKSVVPGDTISYKIAASAAGGGLIPGMTVMDILPDGLTYIGATGGTPEPDTVIPDGAGPGTTILIWNVNSGNDVQAPAVYEYTYDATVDTGQPDFASWVNVAIVDAVGNTQPAGSKQSVTFNNGGANSGEFDITKQVLTPLVKPGDDLSYLLTFNNGGSTPYSAVKAVEVLPYVGDGASVSDRVPATINSGTTAFKSITSSDETAEYLYSDAPPASVSLDPNDPLPAGYQWCEPSNFGNPGCPDNMGSVTAIIIDVPHTITPGSSPTTFTIGIGTDTNVAGGDLFTNNWGARVPENTLNVISNDVTARVIEPAIDIDTLVVDTDGNAVDLATVTANSPVKWRITVSNTGTGPADLTGVNVDSSVNECDLNVGDLAVGASQTYDCEAPDGYTEPYTNTATATGTGPLGAVVNDTDPATIEIVPLAPGLTITKQVDDNGTPAETATVDKNSPVTWLIEVENTGTADLSDVRVTDEIAAACNKDIGNLPIGDASVYECEIPEGYTKDTRNVAVANGTFEDDLVSATDDAHVTIRVAPPTTTTTPPVTTTPSTTTSSPPDITVPPATAPEGTTTTVETLSTPDDTSPDTPAVSPSVSSAPTAPTTDISSTTVPTSQAETPGDIPQAEAPTAPLARTGVTIGVFLTAAVALLLAGWVLLKVRSRKPAPKG